MVLAFQTSNPFDKTEAHLEHNVGCFFSTPTEGKYIQHRSHFKYTDRLTRTARPFIVSPGKGGGTSSS